MKWKGKKIGVLMGGWSKEREISLRSGKAVYEAICRRGYNAISIDCDKNLPAQLKNHSVDVAFVMLHGNFGEDGCVQGMLEWMGIPYTGSRVLASSLCMDKAVLNRLVRFFDITLPREVLYEEGVQIPFSLPWIVKPSREGSTINIRIVKKESELASAIQTARESDSKILVQEYIQGREMTVSVLNGKSLPVIEIAPKSGFYDFESKYTKGKTEYLVPAPIPQDAQKNMQTISETLFKELDCSGVVRVDFILGSATPFKGSATHCKGTQSPQPHFLEVNTIPGMTETSLVPKAAKAVGIEFDDLVEQMLEGAR